MSESSEMGCECNDVSLELLKAAAGAGWRCFNDLHHHS